MNQYDSNVQVVMDFLVEQGYNKSAVSIHRVCYSNFRKFLQDNSCEYSYGKGLEWQNQNKTSCPKWRSKCNRICIKRLDDVYQKGVPDKHHPYLYPTNVRQLNESLKAELNEFLSSDYCPSQAESYVATIQMECSDFLLYLQGYGKKSICEITYEDVINYYLRDTSRSFKTVDRYVCQVRGLLKFYAVQGHIKIGFSVAMNKLLIPQIMRFEYLNEGDKVKLSLLKIESLEFTVDEMWDAINKFLIVLEQHHYSNTIRRCARHTLSLLFIFLDMNDLGYLAEIAWIWFDNVKPLLLSTWQMARRTLRQFEQYVQESRISPERIYMYRSTRFEKLPDWCQTILRDFLELKKRENMQPSTIDMYRYSNIRLCEYLVRNGICSFEEITDEHLMQFNLEDHHETPEGKNAYNVRIRNFIIYLEEEGIIKNPFLHRALPCTFAQRERIVQVLNEVEKQTVISFNEKATDTYEQRNAAMILLGLKMGLRASDIVNLKFSNIDWKHSVIRLIQKKTLKEELLPMSVTVGNAIFRYITQGRPKSKSPYIFIHHRVPYDNLNPEACLRALKKALPERKVPGSGFHVTRKSFATALLYKGVRVNTIVDSLGHNSDATVSKYLSLDEKRMRLCPLSLAETNISPKGGIL